MERCETCRWWKRYFAKEVHPDIYEGECRRVRDMPEEEYDREEDKGLVRECDHDFGCVCHEPKEPAK